MSYSTAIHRILISLSAFALIQPSALAFGPNGEPETVAEMKQVLQSTAWQLRVEDAPSDYCREVYYYGPNGAFTALSADERIEGRVQISASPTGEGFVIHEIYQKVNGLPDCQGDTFAQPGGDRFMRFVPLADGTFKACWGTNEDSCFGWVEPFGSQI